VATLVVVSDLPWLLDHVAIVGGDRLLNHSSPKATATTVIRFCRSPFACGRASSLWETAVFEPLSPDSDRSLNPRGGSPELDPASS
jgi:hypothetical protein